MYAFELMTWHYLTFFKNIISYVNILFLQSKKSYD